MFQLIERLIGRNLLWRLSRKAYQHARREGSLDMATNGEAWLQDAFARRSAAQNKPLTIIDVGANHGQWSGAMMAALRRHAAPSASMTLFEPVPAIRSKLAEAIANETGAAVRIEPVALADRASTMPMVVHDVSAGTHHLGPLEDRERGATIAVEVTTLDAYWIARDGGPIDLVKIDAEGYDGSVIVGMRGLLERGMIDVVQFEYGALFMRTRTYLRDLIELAQGCGYRFGGLHRGGVELLDEWHSDVESFIASNKVIVHPRAVDWLGARTVVYTVSNTLRETP